MTTWEALFLGIIQGLTEFLPVSSSGHLEISQYLLGFNHLHQYVLFNLICHLGTLCAIIWIFWSSIKQVLSTPTRLLQIGLATLPLFPLVFILKPLKAVFDQPAYLGLCYLVSAGFIFMGARYSLKKPSLSQKRTWKDCLYIGVFQAIAIFPGISRSGATISAAQVLGWSKEEALNFSFLLAIPAILGATILEGFLYLITPSTERVPVDILQFFIGFLGSFVVGCFAFHLLRKCMIQNKWAYFGWYSLILGTVITLYFNL